MGYILAFDGGGSRTRAGLYDREGVFLAETESGPSNPVEVGMGESVRTLIDSARELLRDKPGLVGTICAGLAGATAGPFAGPIARVLVRELNADLAIVGNDLAPLAMANLGGGPGTLVIAGTGSSVIAQDGAGNRLAIGGRGTVIGDDGSAYQIAVQGLREAASTFDATGHVSLLGEALIHGAGLETFAGISRWSLTASKSALAQLARCVTKAAQEGDAAAVKIIEDQAKHLASQAASAIRRMGLKPEDTVYVHGGLFEECRLFSDVFTRTLREWVPGVTPRPPMIRGHRAVMMLAREDVVPGGMSIVTREEAGDGIPTEDHAQTGPPLDELSAIDIAHAMSIEEAAAARAVAMEAPRIAGIIEAAARALRAGGRIVYVGAGTSGRLGVLDASECPPTFGTDPGRVVALIAGGERALRNGVERAEDDVAQAVKDLASLDPPLSASDIVIGITASGTTPYVRTALAEAHRAGATPALVCCNPACRDVVPLTVALDTGPEILSGSTRLKAGTATKSVLNQISTGAMTLSGKVYKGRMVGMKPVNAKLRQRAAAIIEELAGVPLDRAAALLVEAGDDIAVAILMARRGLSAAGAIERLRGHDGSLRGALQ